MIKQNEVSNAVLNRTKHCFLGQHLVTLLKGNFYVGRRIYSVIRKCQTEVEDNLGLFM